jgi:hypothetical protein
MRLLSSSDLEAYARDDWVWRLIEQERLPGDEALTIHQWLAGDAAKRAIFAELYGDLIIPLPGRRVLDVGGGVSAATRLFARAGEYRLLDILAHGGDELAASLGKARGSDFVIGSDWLRYAETTSDSYDVIVAADLFPNVDQRLALFIEKFLPRTRELRLSLTFYNSPRYYLCRRLDGDEVFCLLAWDGQQTATVMQRYRSAIVEPDFSVFSTSEPSLFANGRQVCLVTLKGGRG